MKRLTHIVAQLVQAGHEDLADKLIVIARPKILETEEKLAKIPERWEKNAPRKLEFQGKTFVYKPNEWSNLIGGTGGMVARYEGPTAGRLHTHLAFTLVPTKVDELYTVIVTFVDPNSNTRAMLNNLREINYERFSNAQKWLDEGRPFKTLE